MPDQNKPRRHHIDRRAYDYLTDPPGDEDDLLTTRELAAWIKVSPQFLHIGRHRGYGPKFVKASARQVRYRRSDVFDWLKERTYRSTAEYAARRGGEK